MDREIRRQMVDRQEDRLIDKQDRWVNGQTDDGQIDGMIEEQIDRSIGQMDGWVDS